MLARNVSAEGRSRAFAGGASVPVAVLAGSPSRWSRCTASPTSTACCAPRAQRDALDRFAGDAAGRAAGALRRPARPAAGDRGRARRGHAARPASGPGRPTCCGSASRRSRRSSRGPARTASWPPRRRGSGYADTLRAAAEHGARGAVQRAGRARRPGGVRRGADARSTASATTTPRPASSPTGWPS